MKGLLVVAGLATAAAVVSGALLLGSAPAQTGTGPGGERDRPVRAPIRDEGPDVVAMETRIRALEARIAELQATAAAPPAAAPAAAEHASPAEKGRPPAGTEIAWEMTLEEFVRAYGDRIPAEPDAAAAAKKDMKPEKRWEKEIRRKLERAVAAMNLTDYEKSRAEEILRSHVERAEAIAVRAREALKGSTFGFAQEDRTLLATMKQDRDRLLKETEQSIVLLVGPERFTQFLKAEKAQNEKENAVRQVEKPW